MPLPEDQHVVETSTALVETLRGLAGPHPGFRPAHSKGLLLHGTFMPTPLAGTLSIAPHFTRASTPVLARFSSSTGIPTLPDTDPNGNPRGFALRFRLAETPRRVHTDIVAHSVDGFPSANSDDALALFQALADGSVEAYLAAHPAALAYVQLPKPFPASFATQHFFGVNAFKLVDAAGKSTFVRYRVVPEAGFQTLSDDEAKARPENYLYDEVPELLKKGPIKYRLVAQVAEDGDVTDNATVHWPADRKIMELGSISLEGIEENNAAGQKHIIFDPIPRDIPGLEPSDDPLLDVRAGVYLISGRERRAAK